ncbi:amino acid ABC transporter permease [Isoptericola variabilis]|uniref:Polar amino acid ABC transporter, inner membrane subunit n=1 Tax=Isoptericola variabilis (strain 225) TaxID=743718 RepID=F6FSF0_ISOV2|nr:amino acid ABC transporter permease [Isoptericola variabilis]AEG44017.1 polar amino acid ABC transporter, inner membrane subunit [Isoptericola variabilis 225]TWH30608.1 glutamate transport system permease protein [Isoptericola variabilis J7]
MKPQQTVLFDASGPRARRITLVGSIVGALLVLAVVAFLLVQLGEKGQLAPELWLRAVDANAWQNYYLPGLGYTLRAAAVAIVGALVFGLLFGLGRLAQNAVVRLAAGLVVEFFRAVPVLLMMIFFWLLLGINDLTPVPSFWGVVIALILYNGSVVAELVRSGVYGLPSGQREAALSVGLTRGQSLRSVELPQALVAMLPALVSQLVVVLKDSALGAIIAYSELLQHARRLGSGHGNILQSLAVAAVLFIVINWALSRLAERLSRTLRRTSGRTGIGAAGLETGVGVGATAVEGAPAGPDTRTGARPGPPPESPEPPARWS